MYVPEISPYTVITGSDDNEIKIWNAVTYKCQKTLLGHQSYITGIIYLGNNLLISSSGDTTLRLWDVNNNDEIIKPKNTFLAKDTISCMLHLKNYNENFILLGSVEDSIKIFDISNSTYVKNFNKKTKFCLKMLDLYTKEKSLIALACNKSLKIFNIDTSQEIKVLKGHKERIQALVYFKCDSKNYIVSGGWDRTIRLWDIDKYEQILNVIGNDNWIKNLILLKNDTLLAYGADQILKIWKLDINKKELTFIKDQYFNSWNFNIAAINKLVCNEAIFTLSKSGSLTNFKLVWDIK